MANTSSAKKAKRVALRRRIFNLRRTSAAKTAFKDMTKALEAKNSAAAGMLPMLQKALDKAVKHGTIKKNTAARMKSRMAKRLAALSK